MRWAAAFGLGLAAVLCLVSPAPARACSSCLSGDPALLGSGLETPYAGRLRLSLTTRERSDTTGSGASADAMRELRFDLGLAWSPWSWLTVIADLPLAHRWLSGDSGATARGFGPGELELGVRGTVWRDQERAPTHRLTLGLGLKLPTAPLLRDERGNLKPIDVQLGTGSVDPRVDLLYTGRFGRFTVLGSTGATFPISGWMLLRPAPSWYGAAAAQLQPLNFLAFRAGLEARYEAVSVQGGVLDPIGSGFLGSLTAGVLLSPTSDVVLDIGASIPVINGRIDAVAEPVFTAAIALDLG
ncbi:MAG: transporter [Myxococcota bacterium]